MENPRARKNVVWLEAASIPKQEKARSSDAWLSLGLFGAAAAMVITLLAL